VPQPTTLLKAELRAINFGEGEQVTDLDEPVPVQFNPETLKLAFANQSSGGTQAGGGATQHVAQGSTKLNFDLWFDVTVPQPKGDLVDDVRKLTKQVVDLMRPRDDLDGAPPGVRFLWGTFLFEGRMDSVNETLELFSEDGRPLRAGVSVGLSQQEIQFKFGKQRPPGLGSGLAPGTVPQQQARQGDSVQSMAARQGRPESWQGIAAANGIENPRRLAPGAVVDTRIAAGVRPSITPPAIRPVR